MKKLSEARKIIAEYLAERESSTIPELKAELESQLGEPIKQNTFYTIIYNLKKEKWIEPCEERGRYKLKNKENTKNEYDNKIEKSEKMENTESEKQEPQQPIALSPNPRPMTLEAFSEGVSKSLRCKEELKRWLNAQVVVCKAEESKRLFAYMTMLEQVVTDIEKIEAEMEKQPR